MTQQLDAPFAQAAGLNLRYDLFTPETDGPWPLVVCLHGGGWISGDKSNMHEVAPEFVQAGYAVACPSYRLAPLHRFPAAVEDTQAFVRYARENASALGIDPNRIAALGTSAGGYLAAMLGLTDAASDERPISTRVNAVIDLCGISDLREPQEHHYPISWSFLEQFMGVPHEGHEELYREASPIVYVDEDACPFFLVHGEEDDIVPIAQSKALEVALQEQGVPCEFHRFEGEAHGFTMRNWPRIVELYLDFLTRRLGG